MENDMELDEVKTLWAQSNRKLEASMRLNIVLLSQWNLRAVNTSLKRLAWGISFELIANAIAIVLIGAFAADHARELKFFIPAVALGVYAIVLVAAAARQLAAIAAVDYDEPVVAIQRELRELQLARVRTTLWTLLFGPLMWTPICIVAFQAFFGVDLYAAGWTWLGANLLFGLAVIPLGIIIARRYAGRMAGHPRLNALADAIAGRSLAAALDSVDAIRRFEADEDYSVSTGSFEGR
jgi:hypothetical protein